MGKVLFIIQLHVIIIQVFDINTLTFFLTKQKKKISAEFEKVVRYKDLWPKLSSSYQIIQYVHPFMKSNEIPIP
jgi:hypothetical protein